MVHSEAAFSGLESVLRAMAGGDSFANPAAKGKINDWPARH